MTRSAASSSGSSAREPVGLPHGHRRRCACPGGTATASVRAPCARRRCRRRSVATSRRATPAGRRATRRRPPRASRQRLRRRRPVARPRRPTHRHPAHRHAGVHQRAHVRDAGEAVAGRLDERVVEDAPAQAPGVYRRRRRRIPSQPRTPESPTRATPPSAGTGVGARRSAARPSALLLNGAKLRMQYWNVPAPCNPAAARTGSRTAARSRCRSRSRREESHRGDVVERVVGEHGQRHCV